MKLIGVCLLVAVAFAVGREGWRPVAQRAMLAGESVVSAASEVTRDAAEEFRRGL